MATCASPLRLVPGPPGASGDDGVDGVDGISAVTTLTAAFTLPAIGLSGGATVASSDGFVIGGAVYLQNAGVLVVTAIPDATTVTLQNPSGYPDNVAGGTIIAPANKLGPSGIIGPAGTNGTAGAGVTVGMQGDLQTHDGTVPTSQAVGADNETLHGDSTKPTGLDWRPIDLSGAATAFSGDLPITEGGTGASSAAAAAANLAVLPLAGGVMTGVPTLQGATPALKWEETGVAADETRWEARVDATEFHLQAVNDAESVRTSAFKVERTGTVVDLITLAATQLSLANSILAGNTYIPTGTVALVNGANADVALGSGTFFRITGPTGVFSISGFTSGSVNGIGRLIILYNTVAFDLTLTNEATSTAANRITTLTGSDVTLTGICAVKLLYDTTASRWILLGTQG